ncbi:hypothetical protein [Citrobacter freundii]|uniref:Uncharacterized protein n=1 Tax=Citrobacter freundii TaxID=546 RepID=A0A7G2IW59_CITFR|nr:hypothetical protein [Citrobacter freundii]
MPDKVLIPSSGTRFKLSAFYPLPLPAHPSSRCCPQAGRHDHAVSPLFGAGRLP